MKRAIQLGNTRAIVEKLVDPSISLQLIRLMKNIAHILIGVTILISATLIKGYVGIVKSLRYSIRGYGELIGFLGIKYQAYINNNY